MDLAAGTSKPGRLRKELRGRIEGPKQKRR
jgi:hypothetical protein